MRSLKSMSILLILLMIGLSHAAPASARSVFLNGTDVSSSRNQRLNNVAVTIDENGNLFIEAPQYRVHEENTYMPLSSWIKGVNIPEHKTGHDLLSKTLPTTPANPVPPAGEPNTLPSPSTAEPIANDGFEPLTAPPATPITPKPGQKTQN